MDTTPTLPAQVIETDAEFGRRIRELAQDLGQAIYIPPTMDENATIQIIALEELLVLDPSQYYCAGEFHPVKDE